MNATAVKNMAVFHAARTLGQIEGMSLEALADEVDGRDPVGVVELLGDVAAMFDEQFYRTGDPAYEEAAGQAVNASNQLFDLFSELGVL